MTTTTSDPQKQLRPARVRGIRFLAAHALAVADAYALHIGSAGTVSVQGSAGSLAHLVDLFDATPVQACSEGFVEWSAQVAFGGGIVAVELTENVDD